MTRRSEKHAAGQLAAATAAALAVIVWGALFLIAPVWQLPVQSASYVPITTDRPGTEQSIGGEPLIDVNTADETELAELPGIGPAKAAAIVAYREEHGPFASLQDLDAVKGISARMVETWKGLATAGNHDPDTQ